MTTSKIIQDFKNTTILKLVGSDELITSMGNGDVKVNDDAVYKYIFPYFHVPYTIEAAHSYICMKVNMTGVSNRNDLIGNFSIIIWVIVNQEIMKMEGVGGATRMDYISDMVEGILNGSEAFGTKRLKLQSNSENDLDSKHRCRVLTFTTSDISEDLGCG